MNCTLKLKLLISEFSFFSTSARPSLRVLNLIIISSIMKLKRVEQCITHITQSPSHQLSVTVCVWWANYRISLTYAHFQINKQKPLWFFMQPFHFSFLLQSFLKKKKKDDGENNPPCSCFMFITPELWIYNFWLGKNKENANRNPNS